MDLVWQFLAPVPAAIGIAAIVWRLISDARPVRAIGHDEVKGRPDPRLAAHVGSIDSRPGPVPARDHAAATVMAGASLSGKH